MPSYCAAINCTNTSGKVTKDISLGVSIDSLLELSQELLSEGFHFVCTSRLSRFNQDCLEIFFSIIRSKGGWNDRPTVRQFRAAYQNALLLLSVETVKSNANCLVETDFSTALDLNTLLENTHGRVSLNDCNLFTETETSVRTQQSVMRLPEQLYVEETFSEPIEQVLTYIAGWLIRRVILCDGCEKVLCRESKDAPASNEQFIQAKKYTDTSKLMSPNLLLVSFVRDMETIFMRFIAQWLDMQGLAMRLTHKIMEHCNFEFLLKDHPEHAFHLEKNIVKMFVVTRIFYFIKFYNRDMNPCNKKMLRRWHGLCTNKYES